MLGRRIATKQVDPRAVGDFADLADDAPIERFVSHVGNERRIDQDQVDRPVPQPLGRILDDPSEHFGVGPRERVERPHLPQDQVRPDASHLVAHGLEATGGGHGPPALVDEVHRDARQAALQRLDQTAALALGQGRAADLRADDKDPQRFVAAIDELFGTRQAAGELEVDFGDSTALRAGRRGDRTDDEQGRGREAAQACAMSADDAARVARDDVVEGLPRYHSSTQASASCTTMPPGMIIKSRAG